MLWVVFELVTVWVQRPALRRGGVLSVGAAAVAEAGAAAPPATGVAASFLEHPASASAATPQIRIACFILNPPSPCSVWGEGSRGPVPGEPSYVGPRPARHRRSLRNGRARADDLRRLP